MRQQQVKEPTLVGTNGKMMDLVLRNPEYIELKTGPLQWKRVISEAVKVGLSPSP